jgi:hypothetical protein
MDSLRKELELVIEYLISDQAMCRHLQKNLDTSNQILSASLTIEESRRSIEASSQALKQVEALKVFTIVTAFFLPLSFIAGVSSLQLDCILTNTTYNRSSSAFLRLVSKPMILSQLQVGLQYLSQCGCWLQHLSQCWLQRPTKRFSSFSTGSSCCLQDSGVMRVICS